VFRVTTRDPGTGDEDLLYVLTRSRFWAARLVGRWPAALCVPQGRDVTGCAPTAPVLA
jgi:hypothetical protein